MSCWAACLDLQSTGKRMQQPGESWAGVTLIAGGGLSHRHPGDELPWENSWVLPLLGPAKQLPMLGTA